MLLLSRFGMSHSTPYVPPPAPVIPGPKVLAYGDSTMGFYGEVASADFISGSALSAAVGLSAGTLIIDNVTWLKFILDGQILFIPKVCIRHSATWEDIYQAGAVYGDSTYGTFPSGTNRLQDASVTIGGKQFTVRLLSGSTGDNVGAAYGNDIVISRGSEFSRLFYPLSTTAVASAPSPKWNLYTDGQLDIAHYSLCKDKHSYGATYRVARGTGNISALNRLAVTHMAATIAWRPCLVLQ